MPVWSFLYLLMGYSFYLILASKDNLSLIKKEVCIYTIQLILNLSWSIVFFKMHLIAGGVFVIALLIFSVFYMMKNFQRISNLAMYLLVPYLFWLIFAAMLNLGFWYLN